MLDNLFQPTRPLRGATSWATALCSCCLNFNPRAPCGARHGITAEDIWTTVISTHAPLAGRDETACMLPWMAGIFQPTRPLRGATPDGSPLTYKHSQFQPTRPLRGATSVTLRRSVSSEFQPTRPLRGATEVNRCLRYEEYISTHAPLAGRDFSDDAFAIEICISTHAPLAGRDFDFVQHRAP